MCGLNVISKQVNVIGMQPWKCWSSSTDTHCAKRRILAFDLDDTLTEKGELHASLLASLSAVQIAGAKTVVVTGRGAGWCDALVKLFPLDAVVGENGAVVFAWKNGRLHRSPSEEPERLFWSTALGGYQLSPPNDDHRENFEQAKAKIFEKVPGAKVATDQPFRLYDLAIDFAEAVDPPLALSDAELIKKVFESLGAVAKVSSIHVNGWWGDFSKVAGLKYLVTSLWKETFEESVIYTGDSPNDATLFESGVLSVGVANISHFQRLSFTRPQFVTSEPCVKGAEQVLHRWMELCASNTKGKEVT